MTTPGGHRFTVGLAACALLFAAAQRTVAQEVEALAANCSASSTSTLAVCSRGALAARVVQGQVGLLSGLGAEVAGSASTLGRMFGTRPRLSISVRGAAARVHVPDARGGGTDSREGATVIPSLHAGVALGIFDGFHPVPTAAGLLSVDLVAGMSVAWLPRTSGFVERSRSFSWGARLGVLRESFTLPGISLSATRRNVSRVVLGAVEGPETFEVEIDPSVTSLRATLGKDVHAVGLMAGIGWDSYGGRATVRTSASTGASEAFSHHRLLYFAGTSYNLLTLQVSAEAGWAPGFPPPGGRTSGTFDSTSPSYFGSVALRLTL